MEQQYWAWTNDRRRAYDFLSMLGSMLLATSCLVSHYSGGGVPDQLFISAMKVMQAVSCLAAIMILMRKQVFFFFRGRCHGDHVVFAVRGGLKHIPFLRPWSAACGSLAGIPQHMLPPLGGAGDGFAGVAGSNLPRSLSFLRCHAFMCPRSCAGSQGVRRERLGQSVHAVLVHTAQRQHTISMHRGGEGGCGFYDGSKGGRWVKCWYVPISGSHPAAHGVANLAVPPRLGLLGWVQLPLTG
eukprot:jgi/Botrbrau1/5373/Bobra.0346s0037.2